MIDTQNGAATLKGFEGLFQNAIGAILALAGIVLFIMLLAGGLKFMTSGGDPKGTEEAKKTLTYAVGGIILIAVSYLILVLIQQFTGAPVTQFKIVQ